MQKKHETLIIAILLVAISLTSCTPSDETSTASTADLSKKNELLEAEVAKLRTENEELRTTPQQLLNEVNENIKSGDIDKSKAALKRLVDKHPNSREVTIGSKMLEVLIAKKQADELEVKKLATQGFKALKTNPTFKYNDTTVKLTSTSIGKRWIFDAYDDEWRYLESEKGDKFITAKLTVLSKSKEPSLFGIGAYFAEGTKLIHLGNFQYRFARWDDYASYLGNNADYRNDFAHSSSIPFSLGISVSDEKLQYPIYLVITKEGCHTRQTERFNNPPVAYLLGTCDSLKSNLAVDDFKDGSLGILKMIN